MQSITYVTQLEAADLTAKSYDTVRRARRWGKLPNSRERAHVTIDVSVTDLVRDLRQPWCRNV